MAQSQRWRSLEKEVSTLRKQFLPDPFNPLGTYPNQKLVHANTRAFMVLGHAELESYLEGWAKDIARASEELWKSKGRVSEPLAYLLTTIAEAAGTPRSLVDPAANRATLITKVFQKYYEQIAGNHGVKEANFIELFAPLGLPSTVVGLTLLPNLTSFGGLRGDHAHHSIRAVKSVLDPQTTYDKLTTIISDLKSTDNWLAECKRKIR